MEISDKVKEIEAKKYNSRIEYVNKFYDSFERNMQDRLLEYERARSIILDLNIKPMVDELKKQGFKYNKENETWTGPSGEFANIHQLIKHELAKIGRQPTRYGYKIKKAEEIVEFKEKGRLPSEGCYDPFSKIITLSEYIKEDLEDIALIERETFTTRAFSLADIVNQSFPLGKKEKHVHKIDRHMQGYIVRISSIVDNLYNFISKFYNLDLESDNGNKKEIEYKIIKINPKLVNHLRNEFVNSDIQKDLRYLRNNFLHDTFEFRVYCDINDKDKDEYGLVFEQVTEPEGNITQEMVNNGVAKFFFGKEDGSRPEKHSYNIFLNIRNKQKEENMFGYFLNFYKHTLNSVNKAIELILIEDKKPELKVVK